MLTASEIGACGEQAAVDYLRREGYVIMETNWRSGRYELDIIADKGDTVHFVEVKYRGLGSYIKPEDALDKKKASNLLRAANHYIALHAIEKECQIDLVAIEENNDGSLDIRYVPNAVQPRW